MWSGYEESYYKALKQSSKSRKEPVYWNEYSSSPESVMSYFVNTSCAVIITSRDTHIVDKNNEKVSVKNEGGDLVSDLYDFENVVPGDVIFYDGHIMMIQSIGDCDGYINSHGYWYNGEKVNIIESVYSDYIGAYGVMKKRNITELKSSAQAAIKNWKIWREK